MKPPIYHRLFGYNLGLLPNPQLAALEEDVTNRPVPPEIRSHSQNNRGLRYSCELIRLPPEAYP